MSKTPIPTLFDETKTYVIGCDCCRKKTSTTDPSQLPVGWREVHVKGYVGAWICCSDLCEQKALSKAVTTA